MKILFLIPARGGSKGLPGKNIKPLNGKPLICYTIDAARLVSNDKDICVSTDDNIIKEVVESYGLKVPFIRPAELSTDSASSEQVLKHTIDFFEQQERVYDYVILLQPTSPLRTGRHLREAISLIDEHTETIVSVKETGANPYYVLYEEDEVGTLIISKNGEFTYRQECPKVYQLNGAIYIINIQKFKEKGLKHMRKVKYLMDKKSSIDIDDIIDFKLSELILTEKL